MSSEKARSYLSRIGSRSEADSREDGLKKPTSPSTNDRPRYTGYKAGEESTGTYNSLRKSGLSAPNVARSDSNSLSSMKRNGHSGSQGSIQVSTTSTTSTSIPSPGGRYSSSAYVPIGKRLQNSYLSGSTGGLSGSTVTNNKEEPEDDQLSAGARREAREAFLRGETQKYDPTLRERENLSAKTEREKDKERQAHVPTLSHSNHERERPSKSGPKEIIADGYVGFANLPNQVYRKAVKRGFEFTLMVVGESGQGKSTLINSMFLTDLYSNEYPGPSHRVKKTVQVETTQVVLKEGGVQLRLTVVDTPGFGDAVDNSNCWQPITDHVEAKYEEYLNAESRVHRSIQPDLRVHCCLYFISPNGHGLKPLDIEFMRRLHDKVNIIPLIAKSDTMTPEECRDFKKTILNEIAQHKIRIYEFPDGEDEEENKIQKRLKDRVPFAVVGSNTVVEAGGKKVRGRIYPWGTVEVENLEHNDFIALRNMLIRTHMQDLKDVTNNVHYENYRYNKLASVSQDGKSKGSGKFLSSPVAALRKKKLGRSHSANPMSPISSNSLSHPLYNNMGRSPSQRSVRSLQELSPNRSHPATDSDTSSVDFGDSDAVHNTSSVGVQVTTRLLLSPLLQLDEERREHEAKMKKMEAEMEQVFEMKVKEKKNKLKESEADLQKKAEQMHRTQEQQERDLAERQAAFEKERKVWEEQERHITEQMRTLEKEKSKKKGIF